MLLILLLYLLRLDGQTNLVLNPSFEDTIQCVDGESQFQDYVSNWRGASGDYFSSFCQGYDVEVPANVLGTQYPRTGNAYTGVYCTLVDTISSHENARDIIEGQLTTPLEAGERYCVSFYVSLGDSVKYVCPIGFYFANDSAASFSGYWNGTIPDYMDSGLSHLNDTMNWILVSTIYTAVGGERYITIGNHWDDTVTTLQIVNPNAPSIYSSCYFYIDDVSVIPYAEARTGYDSTICANDSMELWSLDKPGLSYTWSPGESLSDSTSSNPFATPLQNTTYTLTIADTSGIYCLGNTMDSVTIRVIDCAVADTFFVPTIFVDDDVFVIFGLTSPVALEIFDDRGRLVYKNNSYQNTFSVINLDVGIYFYRLSTLGQAGKFAVIR